MLGATTTDLGTNTDSHGEQSATLLPSRSYKCTSCQLSFESSQDQRVHMKEPWHVYNIKRRIASLPSISLDVFTTKIEAKSEKNSDFDETTSNSSNDDSDKKSTVNEDEQTASPVQCLFCSQAFECSDDGLTRNLEHMHTAHGLSIPNSDMVVDMQTFLGYLATEVRTWHECLYCGATKDSTPSIQNHMRDKRHCQLNFDREPELLDFWERKEGAEVNEGGTTTLELEQEEATNFVLSDTEIHLTSGKVINSRHAPSTPVSRLQRKPASAHRPSAAETTELLPLPVGPQQTWSRQLARRDEMSILGISVQQHHALVLAEKKAQRSEAVARRAREWVYAKGANAQKYDQLDNRAKWGKQQHKLLPR